MLSKGKINCPDCEKPLTYLVRFKSGAMFCKNLKCDFVMYFLKGGGSITSHTKKIEVLEELLYKKEPICFRPAYSWIEVQKIRITSWLELKLFPISFRLRMYKMKRKYKHTNPEAYELICKTEELFKESKKYVRSKI